MRAIVLAAFTAAVIGLIGTAPTMAAPAQGGVIGQAALAASPVTKVVVCVRRRVCGARGCVMRRVCT